MEKIYTHYGDFVHLIFSDEQMINADYFMLFTWNNTKLPKIIIEHYDNETIHQEIINILECIRLIEDDMTPEKLIQLIEGIGYKKLTID